MSWTINSIATFGPITSQYSSEQQLLNLGVTPSGNYIFAGIYSNIGSTNLYRYNGTAWQILYSLSNNNGIIILSTDYDGKTIIFGTEYGIKLYISKDYGATFTECSIPNIDMTQYYYTQPQSLRMSLDGSTIIYSMAHNSPGSYNAGVWISTNTAATWTKSLSGNWHRGYFPYDKPNYMYALTSSGNQHNTQVNFSSNTGATWNIVLNNNLGFTSAICGSNDGNIIYITGTYGRKITNNNWANATVIGEANRVVGCCDKTGSILFQLSGAGTPGLYVSTNGGTTFNGYSSTSIDFAQMKYCDLYGRILPINSQLSGNLVSNGGGTFSFAIATATTIPSSVTINGTITTVDGTVTVPARTQSVTVSASGASYPPTITGTTNLKDDLNTLVINSFGINYNVYVMVLRNCFKEDTKILCYVDDEEQYIPVQDMKVGTLVKTLLNGYIPVHSIGHSEMHNPANNLRGRNRLYKCTKENYPEITEDLVITGCHSILMDIETLTPDIRQKTKELSGHEELTTDRMYRLMACIDERAEPYTEEGLHTIWHFALDHFDETMNYGVYANGLLVESCDIKMMRDYSGLELLEDKKSEE